MEEAQRRMIVRALARGEAPTAIASSLGVGKSTAYRMREKMKNHRDEGDNEDIVRRKPHERHRPVRTPELVESVRQTVAEDPSTGISSLARDSEISRRTMQRVVHEDLGMKSYRMDQRQFLSNTARERRKNRSAAILNRLKGSDAGKIIVFSDEKWWTVEKVHNRQNDRYLSPAGDAATTPEEYCIVAKKQRALGVMFLGLVASNGLVSPPVWVPEGVKINSKGYIEIMKNNVIPWLRANFSPGSFVLQQDNAPGHAARATQQFLREELGDDFWPSSMWPPSSPDCNPLDYYVWNEVARMACTNCHTNINELKNDVEAAWRGQDPENIRRACKSFRRRIQAVYDADGGYIE